MREIKRAAVLGSGVMGGAIAAHLANCGIPSLMLDIVPPNLSEKDKKNKGKRNGFGEASKAGLLKAKPSPIYQKSNLDMIEVGNFDDDFERIADCDLIIEVVKEDLAIKKKVFEKVSKFRAPGSIVATNTSGLLIRTMVDVMDEDMRKHFLCTHFFNPPRYLKLLELVPSPDTLPEVMQYMGRFGEDVLGKGVVYAKDTPNFVANRILIFAMQYIMFEMVKDGLTVEEVDALTGPNIGHASSATFRTADLVGLDTYIHVMGNVANGCPDDERLDLMVVPDFLQKMVDKGWFGSKSGSGFYKATDQRDEKGKRVVNGIDLATCEYRAPVKARFDCIAAARSAKKPVDKIRAMHNGEDKGSKFVWKLFANTAVYAGNRIPEIADDIVQIDNAVKWGFAWDFGIFETWDMLGFTAVCDRMKADGLELPPIAKAMIKAGVDAFYSTDASGNRTYFDVASKGYKPVPMNPNELVLGAVKKAKGVVKTNDSCSLIDLGDGILCAEFHSKMNTVDADLGKMLGEGVTLVNDGQFRGMVVANQGAHFSAGANLMFVLGFAMQENWDAIDKMVADFQNVNMAMRFCKGPVVSAPHHFTFGGGVEMAQHAAKAVIAAETYGGLVEFGVGLIPAGGGCKEMLRRALTYAPAYVADATPMPYVTRAFQAIGMAKVSTSGPEMVELGYFFESDVICVNWDHQVQRAKDVCLGMATAGYRAPLPAQLTVLGEPGKAVFRAGLDGLKNTGFASEHDVVIGMHIANILTGGNRWPGTKMTEQDALDLEREAFLSLCGEKRSQERMQYMLANNKPLRN
ncbi:MAG TPA: 3-hydroxyacyl-CoA dehydrogenase/enoyl-CoA hydratase family protein [Candidatus Hydrogenedentes bacterium]|nr:3-hydroxyacyl-CoA dehydrogenase/enoyl-CoA hydratase family protein [Candidatus Hydrogenedentota bacterium]